MPATDTHVLYEMSLLIQVRDISVTFTAGRLAFIFHGRDTKREDTQLVDSVIRDVVKITKEQMNIRTNERTFLIFQERNYQI